MKRKNLKGVCAVILSMAMITEAGLSFVMAADIGTVAEDVNEELADFEAVEGAETGFAAEENLDAVEEDITEDETATETEWLSAGEDADEEEYTDYTQDTTIDGVTAVEGQLYLDDNTSSYVSAQITDQIAERYTMDGSQIQTFRVINLYFEPDALQNVSGNQNFRTRLKFTTEDSSTPIQQQILVGNCYYKYNNSPQNGVYNSSDNSWTSRFGGKTLMHAESTETFSMDYFCVYKNNGKMIRYVIHVVRKGCEGIQHQPLYNETNPAPVDWVYIEPLGLYMADLRELDDALKINKVPKYDSNGRQTGSLVWTSVAPTDPNEDFYADDQYLYAKKAGQYAVFEASWAGVDYVFPVRFTYDIYERAPSELERLQTDGVTFMDDYGTADSFAAQFSESYKQSAKEYYTLVTTLQKTRDNTENGNVKGDWDYSIRKGMAWNDNCESAQLDKAKVLAKEVWNHIFGLKEAEDKLIESTQNKSESEEKQARLDAIAKTYTEKLKNNYASGKILEKADVEDILEEAQKEIEAILPPQKPVIPSEPVNPTTTPAPAKPTSTPAPAKPTTTPAPAKPTSTPAPVKPTTTPTPTKPASQDSKPTTVSKPAAVRSLKVSAKTGRKIRVTWKRDKKVTGYQIVVATDKKFKHTVKKVTIKRNKTTGKTISGLKNKKRYYVRVRSYKKAAGKTVYGKWSGTKSVKARK